MLKPFRRIVTAHDEKNQSCIQSDEVPDNKRPKVAGRITIHEIWSANETPVKLARRGTPPPDERPTLPPPPGGNRFRIVDFPPLAKGTSGNVHRNISMEYCIVLQGETWLETETGSTRLQAGDVAIVRGANHAWTNKSDAWCRMAVVVTDAEMTDGLEGLKQYSAYAERQAAPAE